MSSRALSSTDKQVFTEDEVTVFVSYRDIDGCTPLFFGSAPTHDDIFSTVIAMSDNFLTELNYNYIHR